MEIPKSNLLSDLHIVHNADEITAWYEDHYDYTVQIIKLSSRDSDLIVTQYKKRYILSTFEKIEMFALSYRRSNKLSNDTKFIKFEVILLKIQGLQSVDLFLFSLYFTHCFAHYLIINLADKMSLLLYWVMSMMKCIKTLPKSPYTTLSTEDSRFLR